MRGVNLNANSDKKENKLNLTVKAGFGEVIAGLIEDSKLSAFYAAFTTVAGLGTLLEYVPQALGVMSILSGMTLTWVTICRIILQIKVLKQESEKE